MARPLDRSRHPAPSVEPDQAPCEGGGWVLEPVDDREMVKTGLDDEARWYIETGPDIRHQLRLADEFGALVAADPGRDGRLAARQMQGGAFERRLLQGHTKRRVHLG